MQRHAHPPDSEAAMDEMYAEVLRERAAWKRALRAEVEATLRQAGAAVLDTGDCGCGCKGAGGCGDGQRGGQKRASERNTRRRVASSESISTRAEPIGGYRQPSLEIPDDCVERCGDLDPADQMGCIQACIEEANDAPSPEPEDEEICPQEEGVEYFELPDFLLTNLSTQVCFFQQYGALEWPKTNCCPPKINKTDNCNTTNEFILKLFEHMIEFSQEWPSELASIHHGTSATPVSSEDKYLVSASIEILYRNMDIIDWITCMVKSWSPDMIGLDLVRCVRELMTIQNGKLNCTIRFCQTDGEIDTTTAAMWAFTKSDNRYIDFNNGRLGVIIPIGPHDGFWIQRKRTWIEGGIQAFCASIQVAGMILHELVHICGDHFKNNIIDHHDLSVPNYPNNYGTRHEMQPIPGSEKFEDYFGACWDESRMIASMFQWAMMKRYKCFEEPPPMGIRIDHCCYNMDDVWFFAISNVGTIPKPAKDQINCTQ